MLKKIIVILSLVFVFFPTFVFAQLDSKVSDDGGCYPLLTSGQDNFSKLVKKLSKKEQKKQEKEQADREKKAITYNQLSSDYQNLKTRSSQLMRQTAVDICDLSKNQQSWMLFWSQ